MRRLTTLALIAASLLAAGCNTIAGIGRDAQAAGSAVTETAEDIRD